MQFVVSLSALFWLNLLYHYFHPDNLIRISLLNLIVVFLTNFQIVLDLIRSYEGLQKYNKEAKLDPHAIYQNNRAGEKSK